MKTYDRLPPESDWEKTRNQSIWHYDYTRLPEPGADSYTYVCKFDGDFKSAIKETITTKQIREKLTDGYTKILEKDFDNLDFVAQNLAMSNSPNPYIDFADSYFVNDNSTFQAINDALGLEHSVYKLNMQKPGQMLAAHIDQLHTMKEALAEKGIEYDPKKTKRFVVMLEDWKIGQFFHFGNAAWHQWTAGECVTWDWENIPHCTGNAGYWSRPMLQITGVITDKTRELLNSKDKNIVITV